MQPVGKVESGIARVGRSLMGGEGELHEAQTVHQKENAEGEEEESPMLETLRPEEVGGTRNDPLGIAGPREMLLHGSLDGLRHLGVCSTQGSGLAEHFILLNFSALNNNSNMPPRKLCVESVVHNGWLVKVAYPGYLEEIDLHMRGNVVSLDETYHVFTTSDPTANLGSKK